MATVYLARDLRHDRLVALKTLHRELALSLGAERFLREIRVAARLQHPHIVPVFDSGGEGTLLYYTMPYIAGESLRERLDRQAPFPVALAIGITRQVALALGAAHADGIVHRDVKPENILLRDDHALVADFGIARVAAGEQALTRTGVSLGTPASMSPEQVAGEVVDGRRTGLRQPRARRCCPHERAEPHLMRMPADGQVGDNVVPRPLNGLHRLHEQSRLRMC